MFVIKSSLKPEELHPSELRLLRRCKRMLLNVQQRKEKHERIWAAEMRAKRLGVGPYAPRSGPFYPLPPLPGGPNGVLEPFPWPRRGPVAVSPSALPGPRGSSIAGRGADAVDDV